MQDMMAVIVWTYKIVQLLLSKEPFVTLNYPGLQNLYFSSFGVFLKKSLFNVFTKTRYMLVGKIYVAEWWKQIAIITPGTQKQAGGDIFTGV